MVPLIEERLSEQMVLFLFRRIIQRLMNFNILVADDDDDDLVLLANHIKECHQNVTLTYALNGVEATRKLMDGLQPNLIMADAHMPVMNGYELVVWIMKSEYWRHIPIVIWTGAISESEVTRYYQAGANSLMLKQDAMQDLGAFCHHWFKMVQLPQQTSGGHQ